MSDTATFHRIEEQTGIEVSGARHEDGVITITMTVPAGVDDMESGRGLGLIMVALNRLHSVVDTSAGAPDRRGVKEPHQREAQEELETRLHAALEDDEGTAST